MVSDRQSSTLVRIRHWRPFPHSHSSGDEGGWESGKRYDGLIIDDLGYLQQSRDDMEVVFTLLAERYERGSVLMTSNLPFSKWESIFKDAMMTAAAIDRLVHHSVIIELNIPSYRVEEAKKKQQAESQGEGE